MCAAPLGNQFWKLRSKHGRNTLFETSDLLWQAACEYFEWCDNNPFYQVEQAKSVQSYKDVKGKTKLTNQFVNLPKMRAYTIQGLCLYLNCNVQYFNEFEETLEQKKDEKSKDFSAICTRIREIIYNQKFTGAAAGFLNHAIIARDLGLADKKEHSGPDGKPIPTETKHTVIFKKMS